MYTDAPALQFSARAGQPGYPADMPKDIAELREMWEGHYMETRAKRLLVFAPDCDPWPDMVGWSNTFHTACRAGTGLDGTDIATCIHLLVQSI